MTVFLIIVTIVATITTCSTAAFQQTEQTEQTETNQSFSSFSVRHFLLETMPDLVGSRIGDAYNSSIVQPLYRLYRHGPALGGFGFWRSQSSVDICSALTKIEAKHWRENEQRCEQFIYAEFRSYLILLETAVYFCLLILGVRALFSVCFAQIAALSIGKKEATISPNKLLHTVATLVARVAPSSHSVDGEKHDGSVMRNSVEDDSPYKAYAKSIDEHKSKQMQKRASRSFSPDGSLTRRITRSATAAQRNNN